MKIAIIGAGVNGLSTAKHLLENGFKNVTIFSKHELTKTTSDAAVATFYPGGRPGSRLLYACLNSLDKFIELSKIEKTGVSIIPIVYYFRNRDEYLASAWSNPDIVNKLKLINVSDNPPKGIMTNEQLKVMYLAYVPIADAPLYLDYLKEQIDSLGGQFIFEKIDKLTDLANQFDIIINCSGWEAKNLANDDQVVPTRGQIEIALISENPILENQTSFNVADIDTYMIRRPQSGTWVLGTTRQENLLDLTPRPGNTDFIRDKLREFFPEVDKLKIETTKVGLRCCHNDPHSGYFDLRIESEELGNDKLLIHNYGQGGLGFSASLNSAEQVFELCESFRSQHQSSFSSQKSAKRKNRSDESENNNYKKRSVSLAVQEIEDKTDPTEIQNSYVGLRDFMKIPAQTHSEKMPITSLLSDSSTNSVSNNEHQLGKWVVQRQKPDDLKKNDPSENEVYIPPSP